VSVTHIAFLYVSVAITAGGTLAWITFKDCRSDVSKIVFGWLSISAIAFSITTPTLCFILMGIVLYSLKPKADSDKYILYYVALVPVLPMIVSLRLSVPFVPSISLFKFNYLDLVNLIYMLPLAFETRQRKIASTDPDVLFAVKIGKFSVYLLLYMMLMDFRETSVTDGVRRFLHGAISLLVIVMAFRHLKWSKNTIDYALKGVLIAGCMLALIAIVQSIKYWKLYTALPGSLVIPGELYSFHSARGGLLRSPATMSPIPFGLYMTLCIAIMSSFVVRRKYGFFGLVALGAYMRGEFLSGSRGAMFGLLVMLAIMVLLSKRFTGIRRAVFATRWLLIPVLLVVGAMSFDLESASQMDEHGSYQYRIELIQNSMAVVRDNLLFGSPTFRAHPALEASRQGQGIIDVTNALLGMLLKYGLVGLGGFLMIYYVVVRRMFKERLLAEKEKNSRLEYECRIIIAVLLGYLVVITTVSFVDRITQYYWIFIGLGVALIKNKGLYDKSSSET
jgi:O-antigen ligase